MIRRWLRHPAVGWALAIGSWTLPGVMVHLVWREAHQPVPDTWVLVTATMAGTLSGVNALASTLDRVRGHLDRRTRP